MPIKSKLPVLAAEIEACGVCPRLVTWRERVARERRAAYAHETYWGRPVAGFGDPAARVLVVGLAPGAHGANRTGRVFTGDRSGEWLYRAMWRAGLANRAESARRDDGLVLRGAYVACVVRCAPPANKPTPEEREQCLPYLRREIALLPRLEVAVALGAFAWEGLLRALEAPRPWPKVSHGAEAHVGALRLLGSYHPSQQNTFTGRLTEAMLDEVFRRAAQSRA